MFFLSILGSFWLGTHREHNAAIHSATVVAILAPWGLVSKLATRTTSNIKLMVLLPSRNIIEVLVSR